MIEETNLQPLNDLEDRLLKATDRKELESIVSLFNLDIAKKNLLRSKAYSDMVDKVVDEMSARIDKYPGQFSNKELLDYMTILQSQLSKNTLETKELPTIAIQQNIVNVSSPLDQFNRESKDRMRDALNEILKSMETERIIEYDLTNEKGESDGGGLQAGDIYSESESSEGDYLDGSSKDFESRTEAESYREQIPQGVQQKFQDNSYYFF